MKRLGNVCEKIISKDNLRVALHNACKGKNSYASVLYIKKHIDEHMFCRGSIMKRAKGIKPSPKVFDLYEQDRSEGSLEIDANKLTKKEKDDEETVIYH